MSDTDDYVRPPIMNFDEKQEAEDPNWRGEHLIRSVRRVPHGGGGFNMKSKKVNGKRAKIIERREAVMQMLAKGFTQVRMAEKLGVSQFTINNDLKALGYGK